MSLKERFHSVRSALTSSPHRNNDDAEQEQVAKKRRAVEGSLPLLLSRRNGVIEHLSPQDLKNLVESQTTPKEDEGSEQDKEQEKKSDPICADKSSEEYKKYLAAQAEVIEKDCETVSKKRKEVFQKQVDLWTIYKTGLVKISELNDLLEAPDATLPKNN